jgi:hypothetical protein
MGHFFSASAFKGLPPDQLGPHIVRYVEAHGVSCRELLEQGRVDEHTDATIYEAINDWTVVIWPVYFNIHDVRLCADVTRHAGSLAVTVNVYEGAFWSLEVLRAGSLVDKFAPWADYFAEDAGAASEAKAVWRGNPAVVATTLGLQSGVLKPYYRYVGGDEDPGKASSDDEFSLGDFWVFTDIWRRVGITYPADPDTFVWRVRMDKQFGEKLPAWEGEAL